MRNKEEIMGLLNNNELNDLFDELQLFFKKENDTLNRLENEFIAQPGNFELASFSARLRRFINRDYNPKPPAPASRQPDYYEALCQLDFKMQTDHFRQIYKHKKIAAFLLHGDCDEQGKDVRWLYNQLLYFEEISREKLIVIDFSAQLGGSFDRLREEFFIALEIDTRAGTDADHILALRSRLEARLKTGHFICVIRHPECLLGNTDELSRLFNEFLNYLNTNIYLEDPKHVLILLFLEHRLAEYCSNKKEYFMWFDDSQTPNYALTAATTTDMKIIDLAPVRRINESDITNWVTWSLAQPELFCQLGGIKQEPASILQGGDRPYQIIEKICTHLNIPIQQKWTE